MRGIELSGVSTQCLRVNSEQEYSELLTHVTDPAILSFSDIWDRHDQCFERIVDHAYLVEITSISARPSLVRFCVEPEYLTGEAVDHMNF